MYFVTYKYASFKEAGIVMESAQKIVPVTTIGQMMGVRFPEDMTDFIKLATPETVEAMKEILTQNPGLGIDYDSVKLLAPIPRPKRNIFCLGKNYAEHAKEVKSLSTPAEVPESPIYFSKLSSSVTGPDSLILSHLNATRKIDYEVELAIVIGKEGADIPKDKAEDYIFGYTIANDITARDLQRKHSQWYKGKSLDTFCPLGPAIAHKSILPLPFDLDITLRVNGETRQKSKTGNMVFDIPTIIADLSQGVTLYPGDIILTGTPAGVGMAQNPPNYLSSGDVVEAEIEHIGILRNTVE